MPRKKKTREEKRKADERNFTEPRYVFSLSTSGAQQKNISPISTDTTHIVKHDLVKTAFVSSLIILLQVGFFILLKSHLLAINFVRY